MEKITIHRGLVELKTLDDRITDAISSGIFVTPNKSSNTKINGNTIEEHKNYIRGCFDKVNDLILRRNKIKSAIVKSNAETYVVVAGKKITVAEAIERKESISYERNFLNQIKAQFRQANSEVNKRNEEIQNNLNNYLESVLGGKENANKEDVEYFTKLFFEKNEYQLIDPLKIQDKINTMEDEIELFFVEVDSALSESNAITHIEI